MTGEASGVRIDGATALVTGGNRGLGRAIGLELARRGARVHAGARDPASVTDPELVGVRLDVTDPASVEAAAAAVGDVDIVVNNAGILIRSSSLTGDPDDLRAVLETNERGDEEVLGDEVTRATKALLTGPPAALAP